MKTDSVYIPILLGTTREGRRSELAAQAVIDFVTDRTDVETQLLDPRNLKLPEDGDSFQDTAYEDATGRADGFFIVTPEYNHSFPPSLKRMLDSENDFSHYRRKPVALAGVSSGRWGGTRVIEGLLPVLRAMDMYVGSRDVHFASADELFDDAGRLIDERVRTELKKAWDDLIAKAFVMRAMRE